MGVIIESAAVLFVVALVIAGVLVATYPRWAGRPTRGPSPTGTGTGEKGDLVVVPQGSTPLVQVQK